MSVVTSEVRKTMAARELQEGAYWMTFALDGDFQRRRVLVVRDDQGKQRVRWADEHWQAYPPTNGADIGLLVSQLPDTTRFEPREVRVESDECSQVASDRVVDTEGKPLVAGSYELYQRGVLSPTIVTVEEDEVSGDLVAVFHNSGDKPRLRAEGLQANPDFTWVRV